MSINNEIDKKTGEEKSTFKKNHLLNPQSFDVLVKLQKEIAEEAGWMPSLGKLVNALINDDNILMLKKKMLTEFKKL